MQWIACHPLHCLLNCMSEVNLCALGCVKVTAMLRWVNLRELLKRVDGGDEVKVN